MNDEAKPLTGHEPASERPIRLAIAAQMVVRTWIPGRRLEYRREEGRFEMSWPTAMRKADLLIEAHNATLGEDGGRT